MLAPVSTDFIEAATCETVIAGAMRACDPAFREQLLTISKTRFPVVLFSLRLGNRSWTDQIDGFAETAMNVIQAFPRAAFLIHGLSRGVVMGWTTSQMSLDAEVASAAELANQLNVIAPVLNAVGMSMNESVAISQYCDVFVAPVGSGMALYKWITNKPGVAFSNRTVMQHLPAIKEFVVFDDCRTDVIASIKLPFTAATDVETLRLPNPKRANFTLDRVVLFRLLNDLILSLPSRDAPAPDAADFLRRLVTPVFTAAPVGPPPGIDEMKMFLKGAFEAIDIENLKSHAALEAQGVSLVFLQLASRGKKALKNHFIDWANAKFGLAETTPRLPPSLVEALGALKTGRRHLLSPWTGDMVSTQDSLGPGWFACRQAETGFICGQIGRMQQQAHDMLWILPQIGKILYLKSGLTYLDLFATVAGMVTRLWDRQEQLASYLAAGTREVAIYGRETVHLGHHVWNTLSAWGMLFELVQPGELTRTIALRPAEYFGSMSDIFGLPARGIVETRIESEAEVWDVIFESNLLLCSIESDYIWASTTDRVVAHAIAHCDPPFRDRLAQVADSRWPLVLFSLRLENRAWVDQIEGFTELAGNILRDFPRAAFLIHGLSRGATINPETATIWMSLEDEIAAATALEAALSPLAPVLNAVGLTMNESVAVSLFCNLFVAPIGSGMALYKWLTNKPGVAISNRHVLENWKDMWGFQIFDQCRPHNITSVKLPFAAVTDVEASRHGDPKKSNFTLDRAVLYETVRQLIVALPDRLTIDSAAD